MAKSDAVWGIDIGQCALKALRCREHDDSDRITVEAFDYVEYPKILSQPEADPVELIREAITTFLSRNSVRGDRVAVSVSGQNGLVRFIKLPPVEAKKIPDIVKYEAKQQIPFALEDVVWDYQQMAGGSEEEGFALETEVGLFAMKRDQVFRALKPFSDARIEVDVVQLNTLSLYNYICFDQLQNMPSADDFDPENPPDSVLVVSMGTDTTDLVITNAYRVWQRSIPIGGNQFTKALTKELKLTFAKAEHLKRNATKAEDPKVVFQAMRPVFTDLVTEIDRSIRFWSGMDRNAKIGRVVTLGNAMKLKGLEKYLAQNLGYDVKTVDAFRGLSGSSVVNSSAFKDNLLAFGVCYGLCLQGLGKARLSTNLLPPEIEQERLIRAKKPWVLAAVATVMIGCTIGYFGAWRAHASAAINDKQFSKEFKRVEATKALSTSLINDYTAKKTKYDEVKTIGSHLVGIDERRFLWIELLKAISESLPKGAKEPPADVSQREEIFVDSLDCEYFPDVKDWFAEVKDKWQEANRAESGAAPAAPPALSESGTPIPAAGDPAAAGSEEVGPTGEGWIVQITGHHFHNADRDNQAATYVRNTLIKRLKGGMVTASEGRIPITDLGVSYPMIVVSTPPKAEDLVNPNEVPVAPAGAIGTAAAPKPKPIRAQKYEFTVQFCWKPTPLSVRREKAQEKAKAAQEAAAAQADAAALGS